MGMSMLMRTLGWQLCGAKPGDAISARICRVAMSVPGERRKQPRRRGPPYWIMMHYMLLGRWQSGISGLRKQQRSLHQASFTLHRLCCRFGGYKRFVERLGRLIKQARSSTAPRLRSVGHVTRCCVGLHGSLLPLELPHLGLCGEIPARPPVVSRRAPIATIDVRARSSRGPLRSSGCRAAWLQKALHA